MILADSVVKEEAPETHSQIAVASPGISREALMFQCDEDGGQFDRMEQLLSHKPEQTTQAESVKRNRAVDIDIRMRSLTAINDQNVMDDVTDIKAADSSRSEVKDSNLNGTIHSLTDNTCGHSNVKHVNAPALEGVSDNITQLTGITEQEENVGVLYNDELHKSTNRGDNSAKHSESVAQMTSTDLVNGNDNDPVKEKNAPMKETFVKDHLESSEADLILASRYSDCSRLKTSKLSKVSVALPGFEKRIPDYALDNVPVPVSSTCRSKRTLKGKRRAGDADFIFPPLISKQQRRKANQKRLLLAASTSKLSVVVPCLEKVIADYALSENAVRVSMSRGFMTVSSIYRKKKITKKAKSGDADFVSPLRQTDDSEFGTREGCSESRLVRIESPESPECYKYEDDSGLVDNSAVYVDVDSDGAESETGPLECTPDGDHSTSKNKTKTSREKLANKIKRNVSKNTALENFLDRETFLEESLPAHSNANLLEIPMAVQTYPCWQCNEVFTDDAVLEDHMASHTSPDSQDNSLGNIRCIFCKEDFADATAFRTHYLEHLPPFQCLECGQQFQRKTYFECHECATNLSEPIKCQVCFKTFDNTVQMKCHRVMYDQIRHTCQRCDQVFHSKDLFNSHICFGDEVVKTSRIKRKQFGEYVLTTQTRTCPICGKVLSTHRNLLKHMEFHQEKKHSCTVCGKAFHLKEMVKRHMACHSFKREHKCTFCKKEFRERRCLRDHLRTIHFSAGEQQDCKKVRTVKCKTGIENFERTTCNQNYQPVKEAQPAIMSFPCWHCNEFFPDENLLTVHLSTLASYDSENNYLDDFRCIICQESFVNVKQFRDHYQEHEPPFKCPQCCLEFQKKNYFECHECVTKLDQPVVCEICQKSFRSSGQMKCHRVIYDQIRFTCQRCSQVFHTISLYNDHMCLDDDGVKKRIRRKRGKEYFVEEQTSICSICGKVLSSHRNLKKHMEFHEERKYKCPVCEKAFHIKEGVTRHMSVHSTKAEFECSFCDKHFKKRKSLRDHIQTIHSVDGVQYGEKRRSKSSKVKGSSKNSLNAESDNKNFVCERCGNKFLTEDSLSSHMNNCQQMKALLPILNYPCWDCNEVFAEKELLESHLSIHPPRDSSNPKDDYRCIICPEAFTDVNIFRDHYLQHESPFKCPQCGQQFKMKQYFEWHNCMLDVSDPKFCKCQICHRKFHSFLKMRCHRVVYDQVRYMCQRCNQSFHSLDFHNDHLCLDEHGVKRRIKRKGRVEYFVDDASSMCNICGKVMSTSRNLQKHLDYHKPRTFSCKLCTKVFHVKEGLERHMKVHLKKKEHECPICGSRLKSRPSLRLHLRALHSDDRNPHQCEKCGKRFSQKGSLKQHVLTHLPGKPFHCERCGSSFRAQQRLQRHMLWHEHGKRYKCQRCPKQFILNSDLNWHMKHTHGDIVYKCPFCDVTCCWPHTLRRHFQRKHPSKKCVDDLNYIKRCARKRTDKNYIVKQEQASNDELQDLQADNSDEGDVDATKVVAVHAEENHMQSALKMEVCDTDTKEIACISDDISKVLQTLIANESLGDEDLVIIVPEENFAPTNQ